VQGLIDADLRRRALNTPSRERLLNVWFLEIRARTPTVCFWPQTAGDVASISASKRRQHCPYESRKSLTVLNH
jgi:hypothetical protein